MRIHNGSMNVNNKKDRENPMQLMTFLIRSAGWLLFTALACSLISGLSNAWLLALINQALTASDAARIALALQFVAGVILMLITRTLSQYLFMSMGQQAKATLRLRTVRRIADASFSALEQQGREKSLAVLTQDLDQIVVFFVTLPGLLTYSAVIVGCLAYLGWLSVPVMLIAIVTIVVGSLGFVWVNRRAMTLLKNSRRREDGLLKHFNALFAGAKELRLHRERKQAFLSDALEITIEQVRVERTRGYVLYALANIWGSVFFFAFIGVVLFLLTSVMQLAGAVLSGFAMIFLYMIVPIEGLLSALPSLGTARVALERIDKVSQSLPAEVGYQPVQRQPMMSIELRDVAHQYFNEQHQSMFRLGPLSLNFKPGELVYLIGGNGSGKTTLAKLIVGLYPPENGQILLNGVVVSDEARDNYRQLFSAVFSDFHLFDDLQGLDPADLDQRATQLIQALQLSHKVAVKEGQFSTLALSTGQRKRLALVVAYLEDRPFYLFDEWAADQDPTFKNVFYQQLLPALKARGKTVLVITHDDRYFHLADRCIKLEFGQLVAGPAFEEAPC